MFLLGLVVQACRLVRATCTTIRAVLNYDAEDWIEPDDPLASP